MKTLALSLATVALALSSPVHASLAANGSANSNSSAATGSLAAFDYDASNLERVYYYDGRSFDYDEADVTIDGDIAGGTNTLEGYAALAEAAKQAERGYRDMQERFDVDDIAPNKYKWKRGDAEGDMRIVISISRQLAFAYMGDTLVGAAAVTTARDDKLTPQGIFPIWLKKQMHYSKAYEMTPMPYTQFLDEHGIALHAGPNPGHPASAGCIRLPKQFAKNLFGLTDIGTTVMIGA
ncbi:L,D-transpeptidase family protein [Sphingomicrobium aestuariivivum]|uniref:L,D-transpeptidase family protein n=1 Tax=Sphingomicrobium aestuariivivum TaxID=1582356 RepID=UPI001FD68B1C|nr:L,D-transpeptidase family protein [Sphingomicrobium aestuariivivum]MCJ8190448.1 L,D-transpeptidase family protein [Sphingomicrobium aestuariivivum]